MTEVGATTMLSTVFAPNFTTLLTESLKAKTSWKIQDWLEAHHNNTNIDSVMIS